MSKVEKFELSTEEYNKRGDSVRAFKEKMKLGRFREKDPKEEMRIEKENQAKEEEEKALAESIKVGDRCVLSDVVHIITTQPNVKSTKLVFLQIFLFYHFLSVTRIYLMKSMSLCTIGFFFNICPSK